MGRAHGRALWLPDILRDAGLPVEVVPGFEARGKEPREWIAQCNHHTAGPPTGVHPSLRVMTNGRPDVPPPLANALPDREGTWHCIASGAANHPGVSYLPLRGGISSGVKYWCLGWEVELTGVGEPFPIGGRQYESVHRGNAAVSAYLGLDPSMTLWDHKSIARPPGRKIDIHPYDLGHGRIYVARLTTGTPTPPPPPPEDTFMRKLTDDEQQELLREVKATSLRVEQMQRDNLHPDRATLGSIQRTLWSIASRAEAALHRIEVKLGTKPRG